MPHIHKRVDSNSWQSNPDMPHPSGGTKVNPFKFMTRNVSWDPNVTIVQPTTKPRQRPHYTSSNVSYRERENARLILHPILAPESTNIIFDTRLAPATSIATISTHSITEPAVASGVRHLRLVSHEFPWTIDVENATQSAVTCADVFSALYAGLSVPITPSEWTLADDYKRESMTRANRNRRGGGSVRRLRRVDWLGSRVYFKGLSRDDGLCRSRLLPENELSPDTWVVKFGSRG